MSKFFSIVPTPNPTIHHLELTPTRQLQIAIACAVLAFLGFGYWAYTTADRADQVQVVVAARNLTAPLVIGPNDVRLVSYRRDSAPVSAIADLQHVIGLTLLDSVPEKQMLTVNDFSARKVDPNLAGFDVPIDRKGFWIPNTWLAGPIPELKKDDSVTILASVATQSGNLNTGIVGERIRVLDVKTGNSAGTDRVMIALDLPTSERLLQARANGWLIQLLVDGLGPSSPTISAPSLPASTSTR